MVAQECTLSSGCLLPLSTGIATSSHSTVRETYTNQSLLEPRRDAIVVAMGFLEVPLNIAVAGSKRYCKDFVFWDSLPRWFVLLSLISLGSDIKITRCFLKGFINIHISFPFVLYRRNHHIKPKGALWRIKHKPGSISLTHPDNTEPIKILSECRLCDNKHKKERGGKVKVITLNSTWKLIFLQATVVGMAFGRKSEDSFTDG